MIKTTSNFKICGEDIIPKFDCLIVPYSFTTIFNQTVFNFFISHNTHHFFQLKPYNSFFLQPQSNQTEL
jgi:hypothetical protein